MSLTVAITGPTGDIGRPLLSLLEHSDSVARVIGMARRPFDPASEGWTKTTYRQGDIRDRGAVDRLVDGADVVVHLAFVIFGSRDETRRVNLEGTRNVFEAAAAAGAERLVYTSSVAAYGFHPDNPQPLTEDVPPRGTDGFYYSAQKAELEGLLADALRPQGPRAYVFRPCIVAGFEAVTLVEQVVNQLPVLGQVPALRRALDALPLLRPLLPDTGVPFQLVHHDDVAAALEAAIAGRGAPGVYNLAGEGTITTGDLARAMGWYSAPVPETAVRAVAGMLDRVPFRPAELEWINAFRVPVVMDTARARADLAWEPRWSTFETLAQTVDGAREQMLIT